MDLFGGGAMELTRREAERRGKPTYHSYSAIPIEQESGPRAAQSEAVRRDKSAGNRRAFGNREAQQHTG